MSRGFTMYSQHKYFAEIEYHCEGKEVLLEDELQLMKTHWPSMDWEIGIDILTLIGKNHEITEAATLQFLNAVKRHKWWAGCSDQQLNDKEKANAPHTK